MRKGYQGDSNLDPHGILAGAEDARYHQRLLDPAAEQRMPGGVGIEIAAPDAQDLARTSRTVSWTGVRRLWHCLSSGYST